MLLRIDEYQCQESNYPKLINDLEGLLDVGEFSDKDFNKLWYEKWTPLKILAGSGLYS